MFAFSGCQLRLAPFLSESNDTIAIVARQRNDAMGGDRRLPFGSDGRMLWMQAHIGEQHE
jgi:hypothetical protein